MPSTESIKRPATIYILMILIALMGFSAYQGLPRESEPDIQIPMLFVTIPYPGASPEDVESLITNKVEKELKGLENLKKISSTSAESVSMVQLEFVLGVDIDQARTKVREAVDRAKPDLPDDAEEAEITEINLSEQPIMTVNLSGRLGLLRLKKIAENLKDEIEGIPGILSVDRVGGLEREVQVFVDPEKLRYYNMDLEQVSNTINMENTTIPAGDIEVGPLKYMIRIPGEVDKPEEIKDMIIATPDNAPVYTKDVANVKFGFKEMDTRSRLNDVDSVSLIIKKRSGENLVQIADEVKKLVDLAEKKYEGKITFTILSDKSKEIRQLVSDLENNIYTGLIFVLVVLLVALGVKNAVFVAMAIPFSMLISFMVLSWVGITLNMVVLFSLILALGMLVDNAIVVVENIYRHLESGLTPFEAAKKGAGEVAIPIITSTITTLAAFFPLLFMPGIGGEFMGFLPQTLIITLTASLFVALIINPVLCATIMRKPKVIKKQEELKPVKEGRILGTYRKILTGSLRHRWKILGLTFVLWVCTVMYYGAKVLPTAGVEFFPQGEPEQVTVNIELPVGSTLKASDNFVMKVENLLTPYWDDTESIVSNIGRSELGSGSGSTTHQSHVVMSFPNWQERKSVPTEIIKEVRDKIKDLRGATMTVTKPQGGPPSGKPVTIEVSGKDLTTLKKVAADMEEKIKDVEGLVNLENDLASNRSEFQIRLDREKISRLGLRTAQIANIIRTAFNGKKVSTYREANEDYDIIVRLEEKFRSSLTSLEKLYVLTPKGESVALSELASIKSTKAMGSIRHKENKRVVTIEADAEGRSGPDVLADAQERLKDFKLPEGYHINYAGENEVQLEMQEYLQKSFVIALILIFMVLVTQFNSLAMPFVILTSVFLSLIGVFFGMIVHHSPISIMMGGIGVISLAGVVVNNAIVLIDTIQQLRRSGMERTEAIITAGVLRIRPVISTAITTILGMLPIVMGMDINFYRQPIIMFGSESSAMWIPMAQGMIYGLGIATILTLIVVPICYSLTESGKDFFSGLFRKKKRGAELSKVA